MFISLIKYAENGAGTLRPSVSEFLTLEKELLEARKNEELGQPDFQQVR